MTTKRPYHRLPQLLLALLLALQLQPGMAGEDENKRALREKEALRRTQQALQSAQDELSNAQRERDKAAADAKEAKANEAKALAVHGQLSAARGELARTKEALAQAQKALEELKAARSKDQADFAAREAALQTALQKQRTDIAERNQAMQTGSEQLTRSVEALAKAEAMNQKLYVIASDMEKAWRNKGFTDILRQKEPVLGFKDVEIENQAETIRAAIRANRLLSQSVKLPAAAAGAASAAVAAAPAASAP